MWSRATPVHADVDAARARRESLHWNAVATVLVVVVGIQLGILASALADHIILKRMAAQWCRRMMSLQREGGETTKWVNIQLIRMESRRPSSSATSCTPFLSPTDNCHYSRKKAPGPLSRGVSP